jgi:tetratricopeptide (TPR) repeat protein
MRALDAAGDRVGALQHARTHAARLASDLDAQPDPQVEAFADQLRAAPVPVPPPRLPADRSPEPPVRVPPVDPPLNDRPADDSQQKKSDERRWYTYASAALALLLLVSIAGAVLYSLDDPPPRAADKSSTLTIAILPFEAPQPVEWLRNGVQQLLTINLDGAGALRTEDPYVLRRRIGARSARLSSREAARLIPPDADFFLLGEVVPSGSQITITAFVYLREHPDSTLGPVQASGELNDLTSVAEELSRKILEKSGRLSSELRGVAARTTSSYEALKAYMQGDDYFMRGQYDSADIAFERALAADSIFALAWYRRSAAAEWNFDFVEAKLYAQQAKHLSHRLPRKQELLVTPWDYFLNGRSDDAASLYSTVLANHPDDVEARYGLAEVLIHFNPMRGQPADSASPHFERVLHDLPEYGEARFHLLELAARSNQRERFDSVAARLHPNNPQRKAWMAVRAYRWGSPVEQQRALAALAGEKEITIGIAAGRVAAHTHDFGGARSIARLLLNKRGATGDWKAGAQVLLAQLALAGMDWTAAQQHLREAGQNERDWTLQLSALYQLHPLATTNDDTLKAEINRLQAYRPLANNPSGSFFFGAHAMVRPELRLYLLGMLNARLGDTERARSYADTLSRRQENDVREKDVEIFARALAQSLRGHIARARGQDSLALHLLLQPEARIQSPPEFLALSPFYARAHDRYTIASLSKKLNKTEEAVRWYHSLLDSFDFVYAAAAHQELAGLYDQQGKSELARRHRAEFNRLTNRQSVAANRP